MSQEQTLQDIYVKIADIYDKFCNLETDPITSVTNGITVSETSWSAPTITLENPDNKQEITDAETEINELITIAFYVAETTETEYYSSIGNGEIVPVPKGSPIMWLPKLISLLVLYRAPLKFVATLIIDFVKEILLEMIKRRLNRKPNILYGEINLTGTSRFVIPNDAEKLVIACSNVPDWYGKRYDRIYSGQNDKYLAGLGTLSLGFKAVASTEIWWSNDTKIEYSKQSIDLSELGNMNDRYGYIYLANQITCQIRFV